MTNMAGSVLPILPPNAPCVNPDSILEHESEEEFLSKLPTSVHQAPLPSYDLGVLGNELVDLKLYCRVDPDDPTKTVDAGGNITQGTYAGTQVALTQVYAQIEQR